MRLLRPLHLRIFFPLACLLCLAIFVQFQLAPRSGPRWDPRNQSDRRVHGGHRTAGNTIYHRLSEPARSAYGLRVTDETRATFKRAVTRAGYQYDDLCPTPRAGSSVLPFDPSLSAQRSSRLCPRRGGGGFWGVRQTVVVTTDTSDRAIQAVLSGREIILRLEYGGRRIMDHETPP